MPSFAQFAVDPRRSPQRIRGGHLADERANGRHPCSGGPDAVRVERRVQRRRSHWRCHRTTVSGCTTSKARAPVPPRLGEEDPKQSVRRAELRTFDRARQHGQLLTEREILERDGPVSAADQSDRSEEHDQRRQHA